MNSVLERQHACEGGRNIDCDADSCCSRLILAPEYLLVNLVHRFSGWGGICVRVHRNDLNWGTTVRRNPEKDMMREGAMWLTRLTVGTKLKCSLVWCLWEFHNLQRARQEVGMHGSAKKQAYLGNPNDLAKIFQARDICWEGRIKWMSSH